IGDRSPADRPRPSAPTRRPARRIQLQARLSSSVTRPRMPSPGYPTFRPQPQPAKRRFYALFTAGSSPPAGPFYGRPSGQLTTTLQSCHPRRPWRIRKASMKRLKRRIRELVGYLLSPELALEVPRCPSSDWLPPSLDPHDWSNSLLAAMADTGSAWYFELR